MSRFARVSATWGRRASLRDDVCPGQTSVSAPSSRCCGGPRATRVDADVGVKEKRPKRLALFVEIHLPPRKSNGLGAYSLCVRGNGWTRAALAFHPLNKVWRLPHIAVQTHRDGGGRQPFMVSRRIQYLGASAAAPSLGAARKRDSVGQCDGGARMRSLVSVLSTARGEFGADGAPIEKL